MNKIFALLLFGVFTFISASASEPQIWTVNSRPDIMRGEARSVSINPNGSLAPAPKLTELFATQQPFIWASAVDAEGNIYLGTGSEGRIFRYAANGNGSLFADLNELNVSAIAIRGNDIFAATSPDGKVYRLDRSGTATVYFEPGEKYIWSLAVMPDGSLAVGTGEGGKIYRVRAAGATAASSLLFDTSESHIISLAVDGGGNLYAGTDSNGLVLRFGTDGKPFGLLDSPLREIHEISVGPDGSVYVLALGESASAAKPEAAASPTPSTIAPATANPMQPPTPQKSRSDLSGAKSAIYRIHKDGGADVIWSSATVVGFSIQAHQTGGGVLLGTSDRGRIYDVADDGSETLALQTEANQISTIFRRGSELFAASSNQGKLYKVGPERVTEGVYESPVLDTKAGAAWGNAWWTSTGSVAIETRSGNTESPNETWSSWQQVRSAGNRGKVESPNARFIQWRARMTGGTTSLREVSLAYIPRNLAPEVTSLQILAANVGLASNPPVQIDPNIELTGLSPANFGIVIAPQVPRRIFQRGARSFQWTAEDGNGDKLSYDIYLKEVAARDFKLLRRGLSENFFALDGLSLADGRYVIKIVASDAPGNPAGVSLTGELTSEPFDVDNSQPVVSVAGQPQIVGGIARVEFAASDKGSYIVRAEYSVNGGEWQAVYAVDGISDGPDERYTLEIPLSGTGEISVTLRVFDTNGNIGNARAVVRR